jgi:hypothetical protein
MLAEPEPLAVQVAADLGVAQEILQVRQALMD